MLMVVDGGVLLLAFDVLILVGNDIFTSVFCVLSFASAHSDF